MLERAKDFPDERSLRAMRANGAEFLLVHGQHFGSPDEYGAAALALELRTDMTAITTSEDGGGVVRVYRLERPSAPAP